MELRIPKADMSARTIYDFKRLGQRHVFLLPCEISEERETIRMSFRLDGFRPLTELKEAEDSVKLACLWQIAEFKELYQRLNFSLKPENLYYDISGRVRVMVRDIIPAVHKDRELQFLTQYKALIIYMTEESMHLYEDYLSGMSRNLNGLNERSGFWVTETTPEIKAVLEADTVSEVKELLEEAYNRMREKEKKDMVRVERKKYERMKRCRIVSAVLFVLYTAAAFYCLAWYRL